jgi:CheY-like chemotaxis protein
LQALQQARAEGDPFKLALVDMHMPEMDGEAVGRAVRADGDLADTRLVVLASLGLRCEAGRLREIGFSGHATKPVRREVLKGVLSQALAGAPDSESRPNAACPMADDPLPGLARRKARILLAEDNITNQQVALGVLKKLGLTADAVANGREALHALRTTPYDLVLMDVQMPVMDGMETTRAIRTRELGGRMIPIIAVTAHAMRGDREKCLAAGMNDYISKPVSPRALSEVLGKWLPKDSAVGLLTSEVESRPRPPNHQPTPLVWNRAAMVERLLGDEELAETILQGFLTDIPRQIETLRVYLEALDAGGVQRQAHTIKGAAANVEGQALRAKALELETAARTGDLRSAETLFQDLLSAFEALGHAMKMDSP